MKILLLRYQVVRDAINNANWRQGCTAFFQGDSGIFGQNRSKMSGVKNLLCRVKKFWIWVFKT